MPFGMLPRLSRWSRFEEDAFRRFTLYYRLLPLTVLIPRGPRQVPHIATRLHLHSRSDLQHRTLTESHILQILPRLGLRPSKQFYFYSLSVFGACQPSFMKRCHCRAIWQFSFEKKAL
ncbi:hypothetical protein LB505_006329 [Fusarium chuoi]|nr:hypothetical protein LB505_006329 [Fusarium chuoi]